MAAVSEFSGKLEELQTGAAGLFHPYKSAHGGGRWKAGVSRSHTHEYQLEDDENTADVLDRPACSSSALYRLVAPENAGQVVAGTMGWRFKHWLDGVLVAEGDLGAGARKNRK